MAAIFLVVVLAALGAFMVTFSNTQQITASQDLAGSKAYWAARAGLEWGVTAALASASSGYACPAPASPAFTTLTTAVNGINVNVSCNAITYTDGGNVTIFQIQSIASSGTFGTPSYVERSVSTSVELDH